MRNIAFVIAATLLISLPAVRAQPTAWPEKVVKIVVPYTPGPGPTDTSARMVADSLQRRLGKPFIVENRPGASGNISTEYVLQQPADGSTILVGAAGPISVNPSLFKALRFDPAKDLVPLAFIGEEMFALVVHPSYGITNLKELLAHIRAKPGTFSFASGGQGAGSHLAGELFAKAAGVDLLHVPYKGGIPAVNDVVAGAVPMTFTFVHTAAGLAKAGKLNIIAVTGSARSQALPNVPTLKEAGLNGAEFTSWYCFMVPAKTPKPLLKKMRQEFTATLAEPAIRGKVEEVGLEPRRMSGDEMTAFIHAQTERMAAIVRATKISIE